MGLGKSMEECCVDNLAENVWCSYCGEELGSAEEVTSEAYEESEFGEWIEVGEVAKVICCACGEEFILRILWTHDTLSW